MGMKKEGRLHRGGDVGAGNLGRERCWLGGPGPLEDRSAQQKTWGHESAWAIRGTGKLFGMTMAEDSSQEVGRTVAHWKGAQRGVYEFSIAHSKPPPQIW